MIRRRWSWTVPLTVGVKFALLLVVFATTNVAVAVVGLHAVANERAQADRLHVEAVQLHTIAELRESLSEAYQLALRLVPAESDGRQAELHRRLTAEVAPRIERRLERVRATSPGPVAAQALVAVERGWREFFALYRTGEFFSDTASAASAGADLRLARRTAEIFEPTIRAADDVMTAKRSQVDRVGRHATEIHDQARLAVVTLLAAALLVGVAAVVALIRSVVTRVRRYARFAARVSGGDDGQQLVLSGSDELTDLGRALNELVARQAATREYDENRAEFVTALQMADSESEAHVVVQRQLEQCIPGASVVVLKRDPDADRLQASTTLAEGSRLAAALVDAPTRSCLAIRLARQHERDEAAETLLSCSLCSQVAGRSTCRSLLVGGEVIGSVLVQHDDPLTDDHRRRLRDCVTDGAPVLANLRNLALAQFRANNDVLTGVANKRGLTDALEQMAAIASRTATSLAVVMLDLDHFKRLNDTYGHEKGDEVLAAVGLALSEVLRTSDFVGRYGGEEFLVLMPGTGRDGALHAAEKMRAAVAAIRVGGVAEPLTASLGVAVLPDDGASADVVVGLADRALYDAKRGGRDRVETVGDRPTPTGELSAV